MNNKFLKFIASLIVISIAFSFTLFARSRWVKVGDNWRYELHEGGGDYVSEKFKTIYDSDGVTERLYYFDYYGNMVTGPTVVNGKLYVFGDNGAALSTGIDIDGVHYNSDANGRVVGLPTFFDLSRFPVAYTISNSITINSGQKNVYDDNNSVTPTASSND